MPADDPTAETAKLLAEHYQKTYEVTYELWRQRNQLFVFLLITMGIGALLAYEGPQNQSVLLSLIATLGGFNDAATLAGQLQGSYLMQFLQSIVLSTVFYLMFNLFHRSTAVLRNYQYLAGVEDEIRQHLHLPEGAVGFTREGSFYWNARAAKRFSPSKVGLSVSKWVYIVLLAGLLSIFLWGRLAADYQAGTAVITVLDSVVALMITFYFVAYIVAVLGMDRQRGA